MAIRNVGVAGCGLMGGGIAQTCAQSGYETVVREVNQQLLDKGMARINEAWDMLAAKGKITRGQVDEYRARLHGTLDLADFADCDLVIEAVIENMEEKLRLFPALDHIVKPGALLLTNTSSLNVTQMGAVTKRPDKVCGLHQNRARMPLLSKQGHPGAFLIRWLGWGGQHIALRSCSYSHRSDELGYRTDG